MKSKNLNVLVTGASRGIGNAIVRMISHRCDNLLLTSCHKETMENAIDDIKEFYSKNLLSHSADHANPKQAAESIANWAKCNVDCLDALILDAGIFIDGKLCDISDEDFVKNMNVNLYVNHYLVKALVDLLRKAETPRVIIIGSTAAYGKYPSVPSYGVAKWALRGYALNLRDELSSENIGVTFVSPGGTFTDMWADENVSPQRLLEPDDIAKIIDCMFTLSSQAVIEEVIIRPMFGDADE